jgi:hypothetical protein
MSLFLVLALLLPWSLWRWIGVARGVLIPVWRDARGRWLSQGNRLTIAPWIAARADRVLVSA